MAGFAIILYKDDHNAISSIASTISAIFGYDKTQAYSCAYLAFSHGEYLVKRYKGSQKAEAESCLAVLSAHGIPAEIIKL